MVQGVLAPLQFFAMIASTGLVLYSLSTGAWVGAADASILVKTGLLYAIMYTGALWEKDVYGRYLFAPAFFWEDVVSMAVIALHTAYLVAYFGGIGTVEGRLLLALVAYGVYTVNAVQFLWKFRLARKGAAA